MKPIIISPPFGSYISSPLATKVLGSLTLHPRPGRFWKTVQFFLDNILHPVPGGYRNRIGLRNPGITNVGVLSDHYIYSIVGMEKYDWEAILIVLNNIPQDVSDGNLIHLELNLGCRNVHDYGIESSTLREYCKYFRITVKLPLDETKIFNIAEMCVDSGVDYLHCSNGLLSDLGMLSGRPAKQVNLPLVEKMATLYPHIPIIAGGGIYQWQDILDYRNVGATYFSTSTIWFRPWRAQALLERYDKEGNGYGNSHISQ